jgi:hypothetical protein
MGKASLTIQALSPILHEISRREEASEGEVHIDVRLHETLGRWWVTSGDPSFDTEHGYTVSSVMLPLNASKKVCRDYARDLIEELRDGQAHLENEEAELDYYASIDAP